jgi:putative membrane protein
MQATTQATMLSHFPAIDATLNGTAAVLLVTAKRFIDRRQIEAHKRTMLAAFGTSVVFLLCYLYYHAHAGVLHFAGHGWRRPVYFTLLASHTVLAAAIVPLILMSLSRGLKGQYARHIKIAPLTYWLWLYVSITGVVIYFLLYHLWRA